MRRKSEDTSRPKIDSGRSTNKPTDMTTEEYISPGEPSSQNSEQPPGTHPSGQRISDMYRGIRPGEPEGVEILRPSERENDYRPPWSPAEGSVDDF